MKNRYNHILNKKFSYTFIILFLFTFSFPTIAQQITGLSDVKLYLDPGHAIKENEGLYNYTEAEKTLRVALAIRDYLKEYTDMVDIYMCREDDETQITLNGRTDMANSLNVDFYYSIHSDAADATANNTTLTMYGGWRVEGEIFEKDPKGGKDYGEILNPNLTSAMRIGTRGNMADRTFYDSSNTHTNKYPYLHVNRESNMASLLSEAGFHTHPIQQQRNLNAEWKKMEGLAAFQALVKYFGATPPAMSIITGLIKDSETGVFANGVTVKIGNKTYTTDTYESLFNQYSNDPELLHNGFYFIEGLTGGETVKVEFTSPDFNSHSEDVTIVTFDPEKTTFENFTVLDVELVNIIPSKVTNISAKDLTSVMRRYPLGITFTRKMNQQSVESAIKISPAVDISYSWANAYRINVDISKLEADTDYTLTIDGSIAKNTQTDQFLDGNGDGTEGGTYTLAFRTAPPDTQAPEIVVCDPKHGEFTRYLRPIIRIEYDELIDPESVSENQIVLSPALQGVVQYGESGERSVLHFIPAEDMTNLTTYTVTIAAGLQDLSGNETTEQKFIFTTNLETVTETITIDDFESLTGWWAITGSGSTENVLPAPETEATFSNTYTSSATGQGSIQFCYAWDVIDNPEGPHYIRWHITEANSKPKGTFNEEHVLRTYVFGDGTNNKIRYTIRDGKVNYEASRWFVLDWIGWKLIEWDLTQGEAYGWVNGDGIIDTGSPFTIDSYQMEPGEDSESKGLIYIDNFHVVKVIEPGPIPDKTTEVQLNQDLLVYSAENQIKVTAPTLIKQINIYSITGEIIQIEYPEDLTYSIDTNSIIKGVYIIHVKTENSSINRKVIVR